MHFPCNLTCERKYETNKKNFVHPVRDCKHSESFLLVLLVKEKNSQSQVQQLPVNKGIKKGNMYALFKHWNLIWCKIKIIRRLRMIIYLKFLKFMWSHHHVNFRTINTTVLQRLIWIKLLESLSIFLFTNDILTIFFFNKYNKIFLPIELIRILHGI